MTRNVSLLASAVAALALAMTPEPTLAFAPNSLLFGISQISQISSSIHHSQAKILTIHSAVEEPVSEASGDDKQEEVGLDTVEQLGRGAAKAKRGKRKGGSSAPAPKKKAASTLAPEEVYYEGPPAITETIAPTVSILTVVGIIPAAAAWARQAWVRYKITTRRIRVTSGLGGKEMAEIVYPDIVEIRTAKRLFGDGDMVAVLRDGASFEMRNIPNFEEAMEFILKQVDPEVAKQYREKGDVTNPPEQS